MFDVEREASGGPGGNARAGQSLCHDLKQPVAAIMILASDAAGLPASNLGDQARDRLRQIESQARLLAQMIEEALEPEPEPGCRHLDLPDTDLDATIRAVVAPVRLTYSGDIRLVRGAPGARVAGNRMQVHRVVANVLDNAVRASGPDGIVRVASHLACDRAVVEVDDVGPGWERIPPGHGLGLAYVTEVMAALGGSLSVRRLVVGRTRVRLELPLVPPVG